MINFSMKFGTLLTALLMTQSPKTFRYQQKTKFLGRKLRFCGKKKRQKSIVFFLTECMPTVQEYEKETTETVRGLFEEVDELFYREEHLANPKSSVQASF